MREKGTEKNESGCFPTGQSAMWDAILSIHFRGGHPMVRRRKTEQAEISKSRLLRSVASSSAIETGEATAVIEKRLKEGARQYKNLTLAL